MQLLYTSALLLINYVIISDGVGYNLEISIGKLEGKTSPMEYLFQFGYIPFNCPPATCRIPEDQQKKYIRTFQDFANLEQTGEVDEATIKQMQTPRCGMWDNKYSGFTDTRPGRYRRYNPQGTRWRKVFDGKPLTWRYGKPGANTLDEGITTDLPKDDVIRILKKAMAIWSKHTNVAFVEDNLKEPDIWIYFQEGNHGDNFPFDGPGRTLAHAFYPLNNLGLSGDMHFDDAETFTQKTTVGRNLLWVATHELGHSLGLAHSNVREAVMYPWYTGFQGDFDLSDDDILGIQSVYGGKKHVVTSAPATEKPATEPTEPPTTTTTTTTRRTTKPPTTTTTTTTTTSEPEPENPAQCPPKGITALWYMPSEDGYYVSMGNKTLSYNSYDGLQGIARAQLQVPIDAAFRLRLKYDTDDSLIVFSGEHYYVATKELKKVSGPHSIHKKGKNKGPLRLNFPYSVAKIEAAIKWQRNDKIYMFYRQKDKHDKETGYYRRYNPRTNRFERGRRGRLQWMTEKRWRLPKEGPDAGVSSKKHGTYFVIKDEVYRYNDRRVRVHSGYPRKVGSGNFINCDISEEDP